MTAYIPTHWTEEEKAKLRALWDANKMNTKEISMEFPGRTRNAIIGTAHRMGLQSKKPSSIRKKRQPKTKFNTVRPAQKHKVVFAMRPESERPPIDTAPVTEGIKLRDVAEHQCKEIIAPDLSGGGNVTFCGEPTVKDYSFCRYHKAVNYYKSPRHQPKQLSYALWQK
jgi:hypothetical protein